MQSLCIAPTRVGSFRPVVRERLQTEGCRLASLSSAHALGVLANSRCSKPSQLTSLTSSMKIAYLFLPPYLGLFAGFIGHSVKTGLLGAVVGLFFAVLVSAEGNRRRGRTDASMRAIDAMTGTEFEDYVAARLRRARWQVTFTSVSGDYGVDLIAPGRQVGGDPVQAPRQVRRRRGCPAGCRRRTPSRMYEEHCRQQSGIYPGGQAIGQYPRLPVDWSQSIASLGAASCAPGGLGGNRCLR